MGIRGRPRSPRRSLKCVNFRAIQPLHGRESLGLIMIHGLTKLPLLVRELGARCRKLAARARVPYNNKSWHFADIAYIIVSNAAVNAPSSYRARLTVMENIIAYGKDKDKNQSLWDCDSPGHPLQLYSGCQTEDDKVCGSKWCSTVAISHSFLSHFWRFPGSVWSKQHNYWCASEKVDEILN